MGGQIDGGGSSSEEEDANWKAAIDSIATTTTFGVKVVSGSTSYSASDAEDEAPTKNPRKIKHYQLKMILLIVSFILIGAVACVKERRTLEVQELLDQILEKSIVMVRNPIHVSDYDPMANEGGVRLFKHSPVGIVFDHIDEIRGPKKRPRILPGQDINEKSRKFRRRIRSIAVDGVDILAAAREAGQKSLARLEAKEASAKEKVKKEEERVAELKRIRGERWLPSIAREMQKYQTSLGKYSKAI